MTITSITTLLSGKTCATITTNLDELAILRGLVVNALRHMPDVGETTSTRQRLKAMSRALHRVYEVDITNPDYKDKLTQLRHQLNNAKWKSTSWVTGRAEKSRVAVLYNQLEIQGQHGNWNRNSYMLGLYNGLELAIATLESRKPRYREKPETGWLDDRLPSGLAASTATSTATLDAEQQGKLRATIDVVSKLKNPPAVFAEYTGKHWSIEKATATGCATILSGMPDRFTFQEFSDRVVKCGLATDAESREILVDLLNHTNEWTLDPIERIVRRVESEPPAAANRDPFRTLRDILQEMPTMFTREHFISEAIKCRHTLNHITDFLETSAFKKYPFSGTYYKNKPSIKTVLDLLENEFTADGFVPMAMNILGYTETVALLQFDALVDDGLIRRTRQGNVFRKCEQKTPDIASQNIPNPDYVSCPVESPYVQVPPPAGATKRPTLLDIYTSMTTRFHHTEFVKESTKHGVDTTKASQFIHLAHGAGLVAPLANDNYVKILSQESACITSIIGLIAH